jgi:hypothetical protein
LDATHFRLKAARAREMAQSGDDIRLSRMLLEVALDLDAEAEAMEAGAIADRRGFRQIGGSEIYDALLHEFGSDAEQWQVQIVNLSAGGARFRADCHQSPGSRVTLELPDHALRLDGTILRVLGGEAAMIFEPGSSADPTLGLLLRAQSQPNRVEA